MYVFSSKDELVSSLQAEADYERGRQRKYHDLAKLHARRATLSPNEKIALDRDVRLMGGIKSVREEAMRAGAGAAAFEQAVSMARGLLAMRDEEARL